MSSLKKNSRILLLDDESSFVDACAATLRRSYQVVKTSSPFEAISMLDASRTFVDLVVCDFNMPGMNGLEFQQELKKIKVKIPLLLLTGAALDASDPAYRGFAKIMRKPFDGDQLLMGVAEVLRDSQRVPAEAKSAVLAGLESYLLEHGIESPEQYDPESALRILGAGEAYDVFLAWFHLKALRNRSL